MPAASAVPTAAAGLDVFSAPTRDWFTSAFAAPTAPQVRAWQAAAGGGNVLVSAPTGSGKTLAAFLVAIDRLLTSAQAEKPATRVLYVSPLKALAYDVDRNLRAPLVGITRAAQRLDVAVPDVSVGLRSGDTSADERRRMAKTPPDILITTPESLFLLLTSQARQGLAAVETVIIDEVHAVAGTKRGAHLAVTLERLEELVAAGGGQIQRIGLSATQRPIEEVGRFLAGGTVTGDQWAPRPVTIVDAKSIPAGERGSTKELDVEIVVPVEDMSRLGEILDEPPTGPAAAGGQSRRSIWPAVHPRILELVKAHRSTIVFANSRRLAERLCARLNELHLEEWDGEGDMPAPLARAHHGSVAREERVRIEEELKSGRLRCVVATSSLELGIDMGAVDLVVQVESPGSVASGLQRIGRAGHSVGEASIGKVFPKYRGDLVECAVVVKRMHEGAIEETRIPHNPLDVLAQQVVAMAAMDPWNVDELWRVMRRVANFSELSRQQLDGVLDMLSGRYPSDEFAELRPRINWDRVEDKITGRPSAQRLAVTSGGTIPDRGLYGVFVAGEKGTPGRRVGELDEEMVYETRPGETVVLGATTWRIDDITRDQVIVTPAPGEPGKLPFWHGDAAGRPVEVGRAVGAFLREVSDLPSAEAVTRLQRDYGLDPMAASNLVQYVTEQREVTGTVPSDRTIVVERFRDEIGDWRISILSPFGRRVHAPWALAIRAAARDRLGMDVQTIETDDGIVVRLPEAIDAPPREAVLLEPDEIEDLVVAELGDSALFAARFRECAARALLLPRKRPGSRTPLWQQRQKAADLLSVASRYGSFPILLETYRECLRDVFDLPALVGVLRDVAARKVRVVQVDTTMASPFASSLLFDYVASFMYEGDAPLAERRASALALDRELLADLLGADELRELIDPDALAELELELQRLTPERAARSADAVADLLRDVGDLRTDEVAARTVREADVDSWLAELESQRRVYAIRVAGEERWAAAEDAMRFRDALGIPPALGLPEAFLEPVDRPLVDLVARFARTHGPFHTPDVAARLGLPRDAVEIALGELEREGRVVAGEFRPAGAAGREWCDAEVLRRLRRRSLAALRKEVEPVEAEVLARFLPGWQGVGTKSAGMDRTLEVIEQLQGAPIPASVLERDVLPARVPGYQPAYLDELAASGEIVWVGAGPVGSDDGRVVLALRDQAPLLLSQPDDPGEAPWWSDRHAALLDHLTNAGASFWPALYAAALTPPNPPGDEAATVDALWDLVWAGAITNDGFAPLRALAGAAPRRRGNARRRPGRAVTRSGPPRAAGRWSVVGDLLSDQVAPTVRLTAIATQLLDRHGVLTRDALAAEDIRGGFSAVYQVLKAMEESGRCRRGYFVEGLGGAQFALPGAVDRLRATRSDFEQTVVTLAATDPANPYGAALSWPETPDRRRPRRVAGAYVILLEGRLVLYIEKGGRSVQSFTQDPGELDAAAEAMVRLVRNGTLDGIVLQRVDGEALDDQPLVAALRASGFSDHPRGLALRRPVLSGAR